MFPVRYYCPRCETVVTLQRAGYLADKSVTPFPLEGWTYAEVGGDYEAADGIRLVCGESGDVPGGTDEDGPAARFHDEGCGEPYYLNFVRFARGSEVEPPQESWPVELAGDGPDRPEGPARPGR